MRVAPLLLSSPSFVPCDFAMKVVGILASVALRVPLLYFEIL